MATKACCTKAKMQLRPLFSLQFSSISQSCPTLCDPMDCSTPGFPVHHQLPELAQTHVHQVSDAIQPSYPPPSLSLPASIFPSIRVFSNGSVLHIRWPKYWSFSFNIGLSNEYSVLIFFRIDRLDLLAVQGTIKNLLQHHSSKASILSVQFSRTVMSDSLRPQESQHARPPCPSPTPGVHPNSCASSW